MTGKNAYKFTCETWNKGGCQSRNKTKTNSMVMDKGFPLLDLDMFWDDSGRLEFQVHQKKNQLINSLNK